ncbi:SHOCT domain-containing protein [Sporolactobacillus vineae]|uniref:SHOCT domain-containing protein n=1 Tax=Sporolactobacillus vineae TaxID=444463 RepID=UPI000289C239|nr:SHOCT domain-containing protein [Sporolactobacillus vineae]
MLILIILLLLVGYYFLRQKGSNSFSQTKTSNAEEILKQRFVSGEIDEDTYNRMLKTIRS